MKSEWALAASTVLAAAVGILVVGWTVGSSVVDAAGTSASVAEAGGSSSGPSHVASTAERRSGGERIAATSLTSPATLQMPGSETTAPASKPVPASGQKVVVELVVWGTYSSGETTEASSGSASLAVGEVGFAWNGLGFFDQEGRAVNPLDNHACGGGRGDERLSQSVHFYQAEFKRLPSEIGKISFEVDWKHWYSPRRGEARLVGGDRRTITLWEGETFHVLDYLAPDQREAGDSGGARGTYVNRLIGVKAHVLEDPAFADSRLHYDLWLEHTDDRGRTVTRRVETVSKQGEQVKFSFAPLRFPLPGVKTEGGLGVDSILEESGSLRSRVKNEGEIEVRIDAMRWIGGAVEGKPRTGGAGDGGAKIFTVAPGETVSMVLPPVPYGGYSVPLSAAIVPAPRKMNDDAPVTVTNGWVSINDKLFYARHQDALILTVTREY